MIAWNKGQTVTWSRGRVMDRFRRGGAPRRRPARLHSTPAGLGEATTGRATDRPADDTHQSAGNGTTRCICPRCYSALRVVDSSCARAADMAKKCRPELRESDFSNLYVDSVPLFFSTIQNIVMLSFKLCERYLIHTFLFKRVYNIW